MGRLVIISNRAPSVDGSGDSGGLVVALKDALAKDGGLWIGGAPEQTETPSEALVFHQRSDFDIALFEVEPELYRNYYLGYSNSVLWLGIAWPGRPHRRAAPLCRSLQGSVATPGQTDRRNGNG